MSRLLYASCCPVAEDVPALLTGAGRIDGVLAGVARFLQQHDQGAGAVADNSEEFSSIVLEPRFVPSRGDSCPNDVSSLRAGQRCATILRTPAANHGSKRYRLPARDALFLPHRERCA